MFVWISVVDCDWLFQEMMTPLCLYGSLWLTVIGYFKKWWLHCVCMDLCGWLWLVISRNDDSTVFVWISVVDCDWLFQEMMTPLCLYGSLWLTVIGYFKKWWLHCVCMDLCGWLWLVIWRNDDSTAYVWISVVDCDWLFQEMMTPLYMYGSLLLTVIGYFKKWWLHCV